MINEIVQRKADGKWLVWSHMPCNELGLKPYSRNHVANIWTITGVADSRHEAIQMAKKIYLDYDAKE